MAVPKRPSSKRLKSSSTFKRRPASHNSSSGPTTSSRVTLPVSLSREERAELQQLAQLLPVTNFGSTNDPCAILRGAALYIDQLRTTVAARVRNGTLPRDAILKIFQMKQPVVKGRPATAAAKPR